MNDVADLRTLVFTIGQLRQMLLSHWAREKPESIEHATIDINQHLEQEWSQQIAERRLKGIRL